MEQLTQLGIAGAALLLLYYFNKDSRDERERRDTLFTETLKEMTQKATESNEKNVAAYENLEKVIQTFLSSKK